MGYEVLTPGENPPEEVNVVIEIVGGDNAVKYEIDEESNCLMVDRFMNIAMHYPANYGFVPKTLYDDGDPVDALVLTPEPVVPGSVIRCRPVAVLDTEDEAGMDAKLLCVPLDKISTGYYKNVRDLEDVDKRLLDKIEHFFAHYKDLEYGKWVRVAGWKNAAAAKQAISRSIKAYNNR